MAGQNGLTKKQKNFLLGLLCLSPLIVYLESTSFSFIQEQARQANDIQVLTAVLLFSVFVFINVKFFQFIKSKFK